MLRIRYFLPFFIGLLLTSCSTINGVGKDIQKGGKAISETAEEVQTDIETSE